MKPEHLNRCQVATPTDIVELLWKLAHSRAPRKSFKNVLDLGAGDGRFARAGKFARYTGIEVDQSKLNAWKPVSGARMVVGDALRLAGGNYDLCIGNPPYIRHHNLDHVWQASVLAHIEKQSGVALKQTANAFILFMMQGLLCTDSKGLLVMLVPYEWVTRPSAKEAREYIRAKGWETSVYRFSEDIFPRVLTTSSIVIIDKSKQAKDWRYGVIGKNGSVKEQKHASGTRSAVLSYEKGDASLHALRGLSPGGQDLFVLTETERVFFSLKKRTDVVPCVTSLRAFPADKVTMDAELFNKFFVEAGRRCWLIRSDRKKLSPELTRYLQSVGDRWKQYTTCTVRGDEWFRYVPHPAPALLLSSGFVGRAPKVVNNQHGAIAVGSVYGIIANDSVPTKAIAAKLRKYNFKDRVVAHANNLRKLEVKQLNAVLSEML